MSGFAGGLAGAYMPGGLAGKMFAGAIVGGCASMIGGGKFESGAVTGAFSALVSALANPDTRQQAWDDLKGFAKRLLKAVGEINILGNMAESMRDFTIAQSNLDPRNASGVSAGRHGDGFKTGGGRYDPSNPTAEPSPLGGRQGGQGSLGIPFTKIRFNYVDHSVFDHIVETFGGIHDSLNSWFWYDSQTGNIRQGISLPGRIFGETLNFANVAVAAPFAAASLLPTSRNIYGGW